MIEDNQLIKLNILLLKIAMKVCETNSSINFLRQFMAVPIKKILKDLTG